MSEHGADVQTFQFDRAETRRDLVFQALGAASACWAADDEIDVLRSVIRTLVLSGRVDESRPLPWMIGSPADEAYHRALGNQEEYDRG